MAYLRAGGNKPAVDRQSDWLYVAWSFDFGDGTDQ